MNVIVAGKQPAPQCLDDGRSHQTLHTGHRHLGLGQQRSRRRATDLVHGGCRRRADHGGARRHGDSAQALSETCAIRFINVVDIMRLQADERTSARACPTGVRCACSHLMRPSSFAYHGYPWFDSPADLPPQEPRATSMCVVTRKEGTTTTPFDMCGPQRGRPILAGHRRDRPRATVGVERAHVRQGLVDKIIDHKHYIRRYGEDMPKSPDGCGSPQQMGCLPRLRPVRVRSRRRATTCKSEATTKRGELSREARNWLRRCRGEVLPS